MKLIIVPCGKRKLAGPAPAGRLYIGSSHLLARAAADKLADADTRILILSAKHALLDLDSEPIWPYNVRAGGPGSVTDRDVFDSAARLGVLRAERVTILAGRVYAGLCAYTWPDAALPLAGTRSQGEQLRRLAAIVRTGRLAS